LKSYIKPTSRKSEGNISFNKVNKDIIESPPIIPVKKNITYKPNLKVSTKKVEVKNENKISESSVIPSSVTPVTTTFPISNISSVDNVFSTKNNEKNLPKNNKTSDSQTESSQIQPINEVNNIILIPVTPENDRKSPNSPNKVSPKTPPLKEKKPNSPVKLATFSEIPVSSRSNYKNNSNAPSLPPKPIVKSKTLTRSLSSEENSFTNTIYKIPVKHSPQKSFVNLKLPESSEQTLSISPSEQNIDKFNSKINNAPKSETFQRNSSRSNQKSQNNSFSTNFSSVDEKYSLSTSKTSKSLLLETISSRLLNYICIFGSILREKDFKNLDFDPEEIYHCIWVILKKARRLNQNFSEVDVLKILDSVENIMSFNKQIEEKKRTNTKGFINFLIPKNKSKQKKSENKN
jgi:hypothetical protein